MFAAQPIPKKYRFARAKDAFLDRLRARAREIVVAEADAARAAVWRKAAFFAVTGTLSYLAVFMVEPGWGMAGLAVLAALALTMLPINIGHDAAHGAASETPLVNDLVIVGAFGILGISGHLWARRHVHNHHMFSNLAGADTDVDATLLLRMTPHHPWLPIHRFQMVYAPLLYGVAVPLRVYVMDWFSLAAARRQNPKVWATWRMTAFFGGTKLIHTALAVAPLVLLDLPFWGWLGGYMVAYMSSSTLLTLILVGTHIHEDAAFPISDDPDMKLPHDWGAHVVMTSCDWAPESGVAGFLFGGLNAHTSHHLLPHVPHTLYTRISPILEEEAARAGLPYNRMSLWRMLAGHYRHLRAMGRRPAEEPRGVAPPFAA